MAKSAPAQAEIARFMQGLKKRNPREPEFHLVVNYVQGANIGGFLKVADAMVAYGAV